MTIDFKELNKHWGKYGVLPPSGGDTKKKTQKIFKPIPQKIKKMILQEKCKKVDDYYTLSKNELIPQLILRDTELAKAYWYSEDMKKSFEKYYENAEFEIKELQNKLQKYELKRTTGCAMLLGI